MKVEVLTLKKTGSQYAWESEGSIWVKAEQVKGKTSFQVSGSAPSPSNSLFVKVAKLLCIMLLNGRAGIAFLTDIIETNRENYEVMAALIEPINCTVERTSEPTLDELNRPVYAQPELISFPGCLTEKYHGHAQEKPMASVDIRYVLVIPKAIELSVGELVTVGNVTYTVEIPHILDEFKMSMKFRLGVKPDAER